MGTKQTTKAPPLLRNERTIPVGRCLFAVVGLPRILAPGVLQIRKGELEEAAMLEPRLRDVVYQFVAGETAKPDKPEPYDHDATTKLLVRTMDAQALEEDLAQFRGNPAGQDMLKAAGDAMAFLQTKMPARNRLTWTGPKPILPSKAELYPWRRYLDTVSSPLTAVRQLLAMTLSREHVEALNAVWPDVLKVVRNAYENAKGDALEKDLAWQPTRRQGRILSILLENDPTAPAELVQAFQQSFATEQKQQEQQRQAADKAPDSKLETTVQKTATS